MTFLLKRKNFQTLFVLILLTACKEEKPIISVRSINEVQAKVNEILKIQKAEEVLVVFDVDMTLTQPDHPATYYPAIKKYQHSLKTIFSDLTPDQQDMALTLTTKSPQLLIEKDSPKIVKAMQDKGVKVIALTESLSGHRDDHKNKTVFKRRDKLQSLGFDFSFSPIVDVYQSVIRFDKEYDYQSVPLYAMGYPIFYHGVLCANGENNIGKGNALSLFLWKLCLPSKSISKCAIIVDHIPKVIIVVDDKKKNLDDMQNVLTTNFPDTQIIIIEYQGAFNYAPKDISEADFIKFWQGLADQAKKICSK